MTWVIVAMQIKGPVFWRIGMITPYSTRSWQVSVTYKRKNELPDKIQSFQHYHFFLFCLFILALSNHFFHWKLQCTTLYTKKFFCIWSYTICMHARLVEDKEYMWKYPVKSLFHQINQYSNNPNNEFKLFFNCIHITKFCTDSCSAWCKYTKTCHLWKSISIKNNDCIPTRLMQSKL